MHAHLLFFFITLAKAAPRAAAKPVLHPHTGSHALTHSHTPKLTLTLTLTLTHTHTPLRRLRPAPPSSLPPPSPPPPSRCYLHPCPFIHAFVLRVMHLVRSERASAVLPDSFMQ